HAQYVLLGADDDDLRALRGDAPLGTLLADAPFLFLWFAREADVGYAAMHAAALGLLAFAALEIGPFAAETCGREAAAVFAGGDDERHDPPCPIPGGRYPDACGTPD